MSLDLSSWKTPKWHKDFGNPEIELEHLKVFSTFLLNSETAFDLRLDCYEEGYMCVEIVNAGRKVGELHWLDSDDFNYGFFSDDDEFKFKLIEDGVDFFKKLAESINKK